VTISGANLGTAQGSGTVRFGSTLAAGVQSWSGNAIHVLVPATLSVGTYQISVNVNGATAYAPSSFVLQPPPQTAMPAFSPAAGTYASAQSVTLSTTTSGAAIRYTTNGNSPTETMGTLYSGPIAAGSSMTIRAIAYKSGWTDSAVASAVYTIAAPQPDFTMTLTSSSPATLAGDTTRPASYTISVAGVNGFNQNATFAVSGYPTGSTATFGPGTVAGTGSTTLTIQVPQNADAHDYPLIISASAGTLTRIVQPVLSVRDYTITVSPPSQSVGCTGTVTYPVVQVTSVNGFAGTVGLTASELNGIYMASISAASVSIDGNNPTASATLTVNTVEPPNCTPEANTQIHLTGSTYSVATVTRTVMARIGINTGPSAISQVSVTPNPVASGTAATVTVTLTSPAPAGGIPVGLASSDTSAFPNASLTIPQGGSSGSIQ
jgi:hypothetical protein